MLKPPEERHITEIKSIFRIKEGKLIYVRMRTRYGVAKELGHHPLKLAHPATASAEDYSHHQYLHLSSSSSVLERKVLIISEKWHWQANSLINPRETITLGHAWKLFWQLEPSIWRCLVENISFTTGKEIKGGGGRLACYMQQELDVMLKVWLVSRVLCGVIW